MIDKFLSAVASVLQTTGSQWQQNWYSKQERLPFTQWRPLRSTVRGPQCATVTFQVRDGDLKPVLALGERFAYAAGAGSCRVYRDGRTVRAEFVLPKSEWRTVHLNALPRHDPEHKKRIAVGLHSLGLVVRLDWSSVPHRAVFGATRTGKTTFLVDIIAGLAQTYEPARCRLLVADPKGDPAFVPFRRLAHLEIPVATGIDESERLLSLALGEMSRRTSDLTRRTRWVVLIDEVADLVSARPGTGKIITRLGQKAGGLGIHLIVASQSANPSVFGKDGSVALTNFTRRFVFNLPHHQAYLAAGRPKTHPELLGGDGDGLIIRDGEVARFRAALSDERDFVDLPRTESGPARPADDQLVNNDRVIFRYSETDLVDRLGFALARDQVASATAIRKKFGGGTPQATKIRNFAQKIRDAAERWRT